MDNNENFVTEEVTENVETPTEQTPKTFTEEEFNAKLDDVLGKKLARREAKVRKEYERDYGELMDVLKTATGKESVKEITDLYREHYQNKGVQFAEKPNYSEADVGILANADADEFINAGYEDVVEEVDRLAAIGIAQMNPRERATFERLANYRQEVEQGKALSEIGVEEAEYSSPEFKNFAKQFNATVPITDVYKLYEKAVKASNVEAIGSMKNGGHSEEKTYYSPEDVDKLSPKDYDNPVIFQRVRESMKRW